MKYLLIILLFLSTILQAQNTTMLIHVDSSFVASIQDSVAKIMIHDTVSKRFEIIQKKKEIDYLGNQYYLYGFLIHPDYYEFYLWANIVSRYSLFWRQVKLAEWEATK
jgi:hypothetical protein